MINLWVHATSLNVRKSPETKAPIVGKLKHGEKVVAQNKGNQLAFTSTGWKAFDSPYCAESTLYGSCATQWWYIPAKKGWAAGKYKGSEYLKGVAPKAGAPLVTPPTVLTTGAVTQPKDTNTMTAVLLGLVVGGVVLFILRKKR